MPPASRWPGPPTSFGASARHASGMPTTASSRQSTSVAALGRSRFRRVSRSWGVPTPQILLSTDAKARIPQSADTETQGCALPEVEEMLQCTPQDLDAPLLARGGCNLDRAVRVHSSSRPRIHRLRRTAARRLQRSRRGRSSLGHHPRLRGRRRRPEATASPESQVMGFASSPSSAVSLSESSRCIFSRI